MPTWSDPPAGPAAAAIRVRGLGKEYVRGGPRQRYRTLRETIMDAVTAPARRMRELRGAERDHAFWALRDVDLDVRRGEVVGVIGRNGSGKSTLLKILSRITGPSCGRIELRGRVGALLDVGTGFHPELTGRENVYVNGALLGMRRTEIDRAFDSIVEFAGVGPFMDTPTKRYSSGMAVRLAFAVAAHLETDVLLVDEVLAVGDLEFQRRCIGKMDDVARGGRTVIFVSHQMNQIRRLCQRVVWLEGGRVHDVGLPGEIVPRYEAALADPARGGAGNGPFAGWELAGGGHRVARPDEGARIRLGLRLARPLRGARLGIALLAADGTVVAGWGFDGLDLAQDTAALEVHVDSLPLRPGGYTLRFTLVELGAGNGAGGGQEIETWHAWPQLGVDSPPVANADERFEGVLHVPARLVVDGGANAPAAIGARLDRSAR